MAAIDTFMAAISGQESGGDPNVVNKDSGAHGQFQIMPANWAPWAAEAGLGAGAAKTQANQNTVARFKMEQYYKQFGSWEAVAVAWYAGPGAAARYVADPNNAAWDRPQGKYPSIRAYAQQISTRMGSGGGGSVAAGNPEGTSAPAPARVNAIGTLDTKAAFGDLADLADDEDTQLLEELYQYVDHDDPGEAEDTVGPYHVARLMAQRDLTEGGSTPTTPSLRRPTVDAGEGLAGLPAPSPSPMASPPSVIRPTKRMD